MDELEAHVVRQEARDGGKRPAERIGATVKGRFMPDRRLLSHPKGLARIAQSRRTSVLMMGAHHLRRMSLILSDAFPGDMHLQLVHRA